MTNRERFLNIMNFRSVDRLPAWELMVWWDKTIERWKQEGLPGYLEDESDIRDYFGLDRHSRFRIRPHKITYPKVVSGYGKGGILYGLVSDIKDYQQVKKHLFPEMPFDLEKARKYSVQQSEGNLVLWLILDGFFWFPRTLLGDERHFYTFYDNPSLIHEMNADLLEYNIETIDRFCEICVPDFIVISEDMSDKNGPMISRTHFDEFILPYYKEFIPKIKAKKILAFVDTDGKIDKLISWFTEMGVDGFLPLEIQAGNDIFAIRKEYPQIRIIGGYDKRVMSKGEREMRFEFERILPAMKDGGYIPSTDHQVPPEVSFENYKVYIELLREYCIRAMM